VIEDASTDGAATYFIANPGAEADPGRVREQEEEIADLTRRSMADPGDDKLKSDLALATARLSAYKTVGVVFPRPRRDYHALQLTASKRLSYRFSLLANYTYSRTLGNYPGTFSPSNGQLDPSISSQFDLTDLLANRNGPLPTDRPHNFKVSGYYVQPVGRSGSLIASLTFSLISGRPIEVLGLHVYYGPREVFILPRGSGGRTPIVTQFDLHLGYEHQLGQLRASFFVDVINLFNQREVTNVDDEYTSSVVGPIVAGKPEDLRRLTAADGSLVVVSSNYGQPTSYQAPLYMRFGARLSF
jgi:hypothetical protein